MYEFDFDEDMSPEAVAERQARWGCGPAISGEAMPTRANTGAEWARMRRWEKEADAARTLKKNGKKLTTLAEAPAQLAALGG